MLRMRMMAIDAENMLFGVGDIEGRPTTGMRVIRPYTVGSRRNEGKSKKSMPE